eukprot:gene32188-40730_t
MTPALLAASRIKEAKTTPDISAEVRAFSAKAVWDYLQMRVQASAQNAEGLPSVLHPSDIYDPHWQPNSAVIQFEPMKIQHKELQIAEGFQDVIEFNKYQRQLTLIVLNKLAEFNIKVNASRVHRSKPERAFRTMMDFRGKKQLIEGSLYGCNLVFVDGPFGVYDEVWDTYSSSFYTYMGGICMNMMHIGGTVILFLSESMLRTTVNVKGVQLSISKQQAIIDAFCATTSDGWPLKWNCHPVIQYWSRGQVNTGRNISSPKNVLQPYALLYLADNPKDDTNKLKKWEPLRNTIGQFKDMFTNLMSSAWYANDLRDVTTAAIANELDLLQDKSAQEALIKKKMIYAQKKAVRLLDHTERKQHYAHYGIVCKGKYLAPIEFKNFCQRLGFIRDVINEAKNMFTYLVGWAKYPD